jgi:hypothetical protein
MQEGALKKPIFLLQHWFRWHLNEKTPLLLHTCIAWLLSCFHKSKFLIQLLPEY